jgi:Mn-dependent DtxR family transcriptional regulator
VTEVAHRVKTPLIVAPPAIGRLDGEVEVDLSFDDHTLVMPGIGRTFPTVRVASLVVLGAACAALFYLGRAGYYLSTDVQIAPFMLTPNSDAVTGSRLSMTSLTTEREAAGAHREVLEQELHVTRESLDRLRQLHGKVQRAVVVSYELTANSERTSQQELQTLRSQKAVLDGAMSEQLGYVDEIGKRVESGLAHGAELVRERSELRRLKLLQLQRERDEVTAQNHVRELSLTKAAQRGATTKTTPEVLRLEEQLLRLELEIKRLQADESGKLAELTAANAQIVRLDDLIGHLQQRPLYRAIEQKQTLAFVPYKQLRDVHAGSAIYECKVWSMFSCERVGRIKGMLAGEVDAVDPWGSPSRGEYAVMELSESGAVTAKTLRVRNELKRWNPFRTAKH